MTISPLALARLHAICFQTPRPWNADEFSDWLADSRSVFVGDQTAFVLGRVVLDEAELLTIAVAPDLRRDGVGMGLLGRFETTVALRGAKTCFLEVAADNIPAISLYQSNGYTESGRRKDYYCPKAVPAVDAILMSKPLIAR